MSSIPLLGSAPRVPPPRERTLVLCFDGTWDSFDEDVSQLSSPSHPWSCTKLSAGFTEFQHRATCGDATEGRPCKAARLLSGYFSLYA